MIKDEIIDIFKHQPMFGTGGHDMMGEWNWSGNYYMYLYRNEDGLKYNYYIQFWRRGTKKNTTGWIAHLDASLTASNSGEIKICTVKQRSLKKCKEELLGWIEHFENEVGDERIQEWKDKHRCPVFVLKNGEPVIITHTYNSPSYDFEDKGIFSYWKDHNYEYNSNEEYYIIQRYYDRGDYKLSLQKSRKFFGGYSSGGSDLTDEEKKRIIKNVFSQIESNPKYKIFVDNYKELI